jgi:ABC-2 type transport system permease protein
MVWHHPVLSKEFRLRMRSARTPWVLSLYLLVMGGIVLTYISLQTAGGGYFNPEGSRILFMLLSALQLVFIGFVTPGLTAGLISGERERQTLAVLLTTNLSTASIVISKLVAALSFMTLLIVSTMPLYAIVLLFGGVSPLQFVQIFGFYFVAMFFIGSVGVLYSVLIQRTGVATVLAYATVAVIVVGTLIVGMFAAQFYALDQTSPQPQMPFWVTVWFLLNPMVDFMSIFFANELPFIDQTDVNPYLFFLSVYGVSGVVLLGFSIYLLPPVRRKRRDQGAWSKMERG